MQQNGDAVERFAQPGNREPWDDVVEQIRAGDASATQVLRRFSERLLALARVNLDGRLRGKFDAEDVLQSVFRSFFRRQQDGQFAIEAWDDVWGILVVMTLRKCSRRAQHHFAERRDARREAPHGSGSVWGVLGRDPTPSDAALLAEAAERLTRELAPREQQVLLLVLAGQSVEQISQQIGRTERTVRRVLERIRARLERAAREDDR